MVGSPTEATVYSRVLEHVFSGHLAPGSKVIEGHIAKQLGVSRIPVRESLRRMVGQGMLTSEEDGGGIRVRQYTPEDIRQLFEFRELLEAGAAKHAAQMATETDIVRLEYLCSEAERCIASHGSLAEWGELDHAFHAALGEASHNLRITSALEALLTECHFLFYVFPSNARDQHSQPASQEEVAQRRREVLEKEHRRLVRLIKEHNVSESEQLARDSLHASGQRVIEVFIALQTTR